MEYIVYLAAILVPLGLCCYKVAGLRKAATAGKARRGTGPLVETPDNADQEGAPGPLQQSAKVRQRELLKVPTPWGWPGNPNTYQTHYVHSQAAGHTTDAGEGSATLHRWVDHLVSSKQTTDNLEYRHRRESSMRALLEDRFVSPKKMTKIEYQKTSPPLLRDPSEPHDQMDNFPAGRVDKIESRLKASTNAVPERNRKIEAVVYEESSALVSPWGW